MIRQQSPLAVYSLRLNSQLGYEKILPFNHKLKQLSSAGHFGKVLVLYHLLRLSDARPDHFTFPHVLKACGVTQDSRAGQLVHAHVIKNGYLLHVVVANTLVEMYGRLGSLRSARKLFDEMPHRNHVSWNLMISQSGMNGCPEVALELVNLMRRQGLGLDAVGLKIVVPLCAQLEALSYGKSMHLHVVISGLSSDTAVVTAVIDMYVKCGSLSDAEDLFGELLCKDVVAWNAMMSGYLQMRKPDVVLGLFHKLIIEGINPSRATFLMSLKACAQLSAFFMGETIHGYIVKVGFLQDIYVEGLIVDMYSKCGELCSACQAFTESAKGSIEAWSVMIHCLGMHGFGKASLMCFFNMLKRNIHPDGVCLLHVLSACSHNGLVEDGCGIFYYMVKHFKIQLDVEHYACLIDLLGRGGLVTDAYRCIHGMPVEADGDVLGAFLGACRLHGDCQMGTVALEQLVQRGYRKVGYYKLLLNVLVDTGRWNDVTKIRSMIEDKKLKGISGCSLITVD